MSTDNKIAEFRESFAFKSGQSFERNRLERLIVNRRSDLEQLEGPIFAYPQCKDCSQRARQGDRNFAGHGLMPDLIDQLQALPDDWGLVAVGHNKRPYLDEWQRQPAQQRNRSQKRSRQVRAKAVGVLAGPQSGGLLFVDHDGISASEVLSDIRRSLGHACLKAGP